MVNWGERPTQSAAPRPWVLACLLLIIAGAVAGSLYWTATNVVLVGRDSAGHLDDAVEGDDRRRCGRSGCGVAHVWVSHGYRWRLIARIS